MIKNCSQTFWLVLPINRSVTSPDQRCCSRSPQFNTEQKKINYQFKPYPYTILCMNSFGICECAWVRWWWRLFCRCTTQDAGISSVIELGTKIRVLHLLLVAVCLWMWTGDWGGSSADVDGSGSWFFAKYFVFAQNTHTHIPIRPYPYTRSIRRAHRYPAIIILARVSNSPIGGLKRHDRISLRTWRVERSWPGVKPVC